MFHNIVRCFSLVYEEKRSDIQSFAAPCRASTIPPTDPLIPGPRYQTYGMKIGSCNRRSLHHHPQEPTNGKEYRIIMVPGLWPLSLNAAYEGATIPVYYCHARSSLSEPFRRHCVVCSAVCTLRRCLYKVLRSFIIDCIVYTVVMKPLLR